jgi:hypothetical protein
VSWVSGKLDLPAIAPYRTSGKQAQSLSIGGQSSGLGLRLAAQLVIGDYTTPIQVPCAAPSVVVLILVLVLVVLVDDLDGPGMHRLSRPDRQP